MNAQYRYWIRTITVSVLTCGYLATNSHTALANVTIGTKKQTSQTQYTRQVYSIDEWPGVREKLCNKCPNNSSPEKNNSSSEKNNSSPEKNKVSVPEPSSVISLLIIGCSLLLMKKTRSTHLSFSKK